MTDLIAVTGNVTASPVLHTTGGGIPMVTFGLASTERRFEDGAWQDGHTNFYNVSAFRALAEHAFASLAKGQRVVAVGRLRVRRWEAAGRTGTSVDLEASSLGPDLKFGVASFRKHGAAAAYDATAEGEGPGDDVPADPPDSRLAAEDGWAVAPDEEEGPPF